MQPLRSILSKIFPPSRTTVQAKWDESFTNRKRIPPRRGRKSLDACDRAMKTGWIPSQSRVLDLGCGEGMLAIRMAEVGQCIVHGVDISGKAIEIAHESRSKLHPSLQKLLTFGVLDVLSSEPIEATLHADFDVVLDVGCFHNFKKVKERRLVAEKMHKVLRPGGKWMLVVKAFRDNKSDRSAETQWRIEMIEAACAGLFSLSHFDEADLKGPHMTSEMPGLAFYLQKTPLL